MQLLHICKGKLEVIAPCKAWAYTAETCRAPGGLCQSCVLAGFVLAHDFGAMGLLSE